MGERRRFPPRTGGDLLRWLLTHAMVGGLLAVTAVSLMVIFDFSGLRTLVQNNDAGLIALAVMTAFFAITFASVQMGIALMLHADDD